MNYRELGASGIEVSEVSLGSWLTYSGGVAKEQARACVDAAFDEGINFIDTANMYGRGAAETVLGEVLAGRERSSYGLATKVYFPMSDTDRGLSAQQIHKQIDASLKRLRTDYVDLYQCHRYDEDTPLDETMEALTEVVQAGKARQIGFSEWLVEKIEASLQPGSCSQPRSPTATPGPPASKNKTTTALDAARSASSNASATVSSSNHYPKPHETINAYFLSRMQRQSSFRDILVWVRG